MKQPTPIDRNTANLINPLIGSVCTEDTLYAVQSMVSSMGYLLSIVENPPPGTEPTFGEIYHFFNVISSALDYEIENLRPCGESLAKQGVSA